MEKEVRCKYCNAKYVEQIPIGAFVRTWFAWLPLTHFSCEVCLQKFYRFDKSKSNSGKFIAALLKPRERSV